MSMNSRCFHSVLAGAALAFATLTPPTARAAEAGAAGAGFGDHVAPASGEAEAVMKQFRLPPGLKASLFAAEPMLANPVAFDVDPQGRAYVVETFRHSAVGPAYRFYEGTFDVRSHMDWLEDDLASRQVSDRVALYRKHLGPDNFAKLSRFSERVRLIEDTDGDGRADRATVFADGFNQPEDGIAAGVLARGTNVWFACIPSLWRLSDTNRDGRADVREVMSTGYGVHVAFLGHDLHGLTVGPDGRLYFSIGDRGIHVTNRENRVLHYPDEGLVLRSELDGTNLEVFHRGLRNPQELAFNEWGDLFTADNNSDGGDRARWVHLVAGGDSGWRTGYQHLTRPPRRGPWNGEQLWKPRHDGQPSWIVPPVANLGYGPSGLTYQPGTALNGRYQGHFFLCDFRGGASSGIHAFTLKPAGASYELATYEPFIWECLPTDVTFGPDGALYFSDWVEGWTKTGKGRLYRVQDPEATDSPAARETGKILAAGMAGRPEAEVVTLLGHADQRVRLEAQLALAEQGLKAVATLRRVAFDSGNRLARLHALWGIGQILRRADLFDPKTAFELEPILVLLHDSDPMVRRSAVRALADGRMIDLFNALPELVNDPDPSVQREILSAYAEFPWGEGMRRASTPLEKLVLRAGPTVAARLQPLLPSRPLTFDRAALVRFGTTNSLSDPMLRHALATALAREAARLRLQPALESQLDDPAPSLRQVTLLALRQLQNPAIARALNDPDPVQVLEAARAINDAPIDEATPALAALLRRPEVLTRFTALDAARGGGRRAASGVEAAVSSVATETGSWTLTEQLFYRILNAAFRVGGPENATALATFAAQAAAPASLRSEALDALADWAQPSPLDRVMGVHRPLAPRDPAPAANALGPIVESVLRSAPEPVQLALLAAVHQLRLTAATPTLHALVSAAARSNGDAGVPEAVAATALQTLARLDRTALTDVIALALKSGRPALRQAATRLQVETDPAGALAQLATTLENGTVADRQSAFATLATVPGEAADTLLGQWMDQLLAGRVPVDVTLDLLDAAGQRSSSAVLERVRRHEAARPKSPLSGYEETLRGGNPAAGRKLFFEREDIGCSKCHTIDGNGGQAGPNLTGIGSRKERDYLLESITHPNARIAEGWENLLIGTADGTTYAGILKRETPDEIELDSPEDGRVVVPKSQIRSRTRALSAMPEEFRQILGKKDLRNLIEFLAGSR